MKQAYFYVFHFWNFMSSILDKQNYLCTLKGDWYNVRFKFIDANN